MTKPLRKRPARTSPRVLAYLRVSTEQQAESGGGVGAQRMAIELYAKMQGWDDLTFIEDPAWSAKSLDRPQLNQALAALAAGEADILLAAKLDRVSRSVKDFAHLLDTARSEGWRLVLIDPGVDTSTASGEMVANMMASAAQYERRIIGQRTKDALAAKKAAGVRLGRPAALSLDVVKRIVDERAAGRGLREIAEGLTADRVTTAKVLRDRARRAKAIAEGQPVDSLPEPVGEGTWGTSGVQAVLAGQDAAKLA